MRICIALVLATACGRMSVAGKKLVVIEKDDQGKPDLALKTSNGDASANTLIKTMEGVGFDTPKGRMTFRKEGHQAIQSMYHFKIKVDPAFAWDARACA